MAGCQLVGCARVPGAGLQQSNEEGVQGYAVRHEQGCGEINRGQCMHS